MVITGTKYSYNARISFVFATTATFLIIIPFVAYIGGKAGFWLVFFVLLIFGFLSGLAQASVMALAGGMPFRYMAAIMLGNGISGISANIFRGLTLVWFPVDNSDDKKAIFWGTFTYLIIAAVFMYINAFLMSILLKNDHFLYHMKKMI